MRYLSLIAFNINAQQNPIHTQFGTVHGLLNPASLRTDFHLSQRTYTTFVGASSRHQWLGVPNTNTTQTIHFEQLYDTRGVAFLYGGQLVNDKNGRINTTGVYGRLGAVINNDLDWGGLSLGVNIGLVQYRLDLRNTQARESGDIFANAVEANTYPNIGLGAYFYRIGGFDGDDIIHVGLSIPEVFKLDELQKEDLLYLSKNRHYYFHGGYTFTGNDGYSYLDLSYQMYYVLNAPLYVGVSARYQLDNTFWIGAGYSSQGAFHPECGVSFGDNRLLKIGFAMDLSFNDVGTKFGNSFEINVLMSFGE